MNYIVFVINNNIMDLMFIFSYAVGEETWVLGEVIKLGNLCEMMGYDFNFYELSKDPKAVLFKDHNYIFRYDTLADALHKLNINININELHKLNIQSKEVYNILTTRSKEDIIYLLNKEDREQYKLLKKLFFK